MGDVTQASNKFNVFISYSRDDLAFADQLDPALRLTGFDTTIDRRGISGGENWKSRLGNLILGCDTVVFVLSPASAESEICAWEVGEATRLGKRIIPVLCQPIASASAPPQLANLNFIFFYDEPKSPGSGFGSGLVQLVAALNADFDWLREHTRLLERASEWDVGGRPANRLLSGADIASAKVWAARRPKGAPEPTALHLEFIQESEAEEGRQQSAEAQRLQHLSVLQAERETAVKEREKALADKEVAQKREKRRTRAGVVVALVLAIAAAGFGLNARHTLAELRLEQRQRTTQAFQMGWRALAGLNERSYDETYEICGAVEGIKGVRPIYCEVANVINLQTLSALSGIDIFTAGPHIRTDESGAVYRYDLRSHEIGRYNPDFINWLGEFAMPAANNEIFRRSTVGLFRTHVQEIALTYYHAYVRLFDPVMRKDRLRLTQQFQDNLSNYTAEMENARRSERNYSANWGTSPSYKLEKRLAEAGVNGIRIADYNLRNAMSFWIRRSLDGTHRMIFEILCKMLEAYDVLPELGVPTDLDDS